jgi:hypothetical protein
MFDLFGQEVLFALYQGKKRRLFVALATTCVTAFSNL